MENTKWICLKIEHPPAGADPRMQICLEFCPYWKDMPEPHTVGRLQMGTHDPEVAARYKVQGIYDLMLTASK